MATDVRIRLPDGTGLPAAFAAPSGAGAHPGVVVIHEALGLDAGMRDVVDRFATHGYAAVVPDLFAHGRRALCVARAMAEVQMGRPGRVTDDIEAARAWLAARREVDGSRLGVIGFCMGGGFALLFAGRGPDGVRAASVNYGRVPRDGARLRGICPVVASYGGADLLMRGEPARLERALRERHVEHDVKVYPGLGHAFMNPTVRSGRLGPLMAPLRIRYDHAAAEDSWRRLLAFFDDHLSG